jgi:DNA-binding GntR family transcriptional regulator
MAKAKAKPATDRAKVIYRALRHAIIEQALEPGAKLPEDAIGERFGASRTIVRSALGQLAAEGLVELRRNRGAAVATPAWDDARDTFDVRLGLERLVMSRLAGRLTPEQIHALEAHVNEEEKALGKNEPLSIRLATEFHIVLAEMTGSPVLTRYVSENASRCGLTLALYSRPHSSECAVSEHRAIITALAKGDATRAKGLMHDHLDAVAGRALIVSRPPKDRDIKNILGRYAGDETNGARPKRAKK